jgi:spore maturation protein CgeB
MRFLILNTDYPEFLRSLYARQDNLGKMSYDRQMQARNDSLFGVADFYSANLKKLGHEAQEIHANNKFLQWKWAEEHGVKGILRSMGYRLNLRRPFYRWMKPLDRKPAWFYDILARQIEHYAPDVIINQAMDDISSRFLERMRPHTKLLVGQIAAPRPQSENFKVYDLVFTSLPNYVEYFSSLGIPCVLNRLAFEPGVLGRLDENAPANIPVSFVGSLSPAHANRIQLLEYLCRNTDIMIWGNGVEKLPEASPIRRAFKGTVWGREMFQVMHDSKITINHHIGIAGDYANNMRLYEATGAGTLLITDDKKNIGDIFEPGKEVVVYKNADECVRLIRYYLAHEEERSAIARAGQARTLREHTYYQRVGEMVRIIEEKLRQHDV